MAKPKYGARALKGAERSQRHRCRQRRLKEEMRLFAEQRRDWKTATGGEFQKHQMLALQALQHGTIASHRESSQLAGKGRGADRSNEPWGTRLKNQLIRESAWETACDTDIPIRRWPIRKHGLSLTDTMAALKFLGKGWGRVTREVRFKDGKKSQVIAVRGGRMRRITPTETHRRYYLLLRRYYLFLLSRLRHKAIREPDVVFDRSNFWSGQPPSTLCDRSRRAKAEDDAYLGGLLDRRRRLPAVATELIALAKRQGRSVPAHWYALVSRTTKSRDVAWANEQQLWRRDEPSYRQPCPQWAAELPAYRHCLIYPDIAQRAYVLSEKRRHVRQYAEQVKLLAAQYREFEDTKQKLAA
jgi:hypothetical protein